MKYQVISSSIKTIEKTKRGTMIVEFIRRGKYEFFDVPDEVIQDFINSSSIGRFFNEFIRDNYRSELLK